MKKKIVAFVLMGAMGMGMTGCGTVSKSVADVSSETYVVGNTGSNSGISLAVDDSVCESEACSEYVSESCFDMDGNVFNSEEYSAIEANGFQKVSLSPLSTFSADVDTASYSNVRRFIDYGYTLDQIPSGAVRTEEMINYFNYDYKLPQEGESFGVTTELGDCPWNSDTKLLSVGIKTQKLDFSEAPSSNIVFLIDVSGSMSSDDKLPLLVKSFKLMLEELGEKDRVSIVTYASGNRIVLDGVPACDKQTISDALDGLMAGGGTNGGEGIISAYNLAERNFILGGNNRVILATDGDLNIGVTSESDLKELIEEESKSGIFLTVLGFGTGNYSDTRMETLADCGNGNYAYIDSIMEAKKVLCEELGATMVTVAKDVKFQVEFNPAVVASYRLIGYEDRLLNAEDFNDDTKDAGEIGAGHTVTALYEIVVLAQNEEAQSNLKYQTSVLTPEAVSSNEWLTVSIRYKEPDGNTSKLLTYPVDSSSYRVRNSQDFLWAATVAEFSQILRQEEAVADSDLDTILDRLAYLELKDEYKEGFAEMVQQLKWNR